MMADTKIAWCDKVWNPVTGCTKIAVGCKNCYAERMTKRFWKQWNCLAPPHHFGVKWHPDRLDYPLSLRKPQRIFLCSMGDLFHDKVPFEFIDKVMDIINICRQHRFHILTKRPERVLGYIKIIGAFRWHTNIWLGVSISTQDDADRMTPALLQIPGKKFVSYEPALGPIYLTTEFGNGRGYNPASCIYSDNLNDIDWLIIGCESGPNRRPCKLEWIRSAVGQCKAAGIPPFVKQIEIDGKVEHDMEKFPKDLRVQDYPKGAAK